MRELCALGCRNHAASHWKPAPIPMPPIPAAKPAAYSAPSKHDILFNVRTRYTQPLPGTRPPQPSASAHQQDATAAPPGAPGSDPQRVPIDGQAQDGAQRRGLLQPDTASRAGPLSAVPSGLSEDQSASPLLQREVVLSDAVREFLDKPVKGPYRPIIFDLETTGVFWQTAF